jgi:hypothetical protein
MPKTSKKTITATDTANTNVFLIADCSFRGFIAPVHRKGPAMHTIVPGPCCCHSNHEPRS